MTVLIFLLQIFTHHSNHFSWPCRLIAFASKHLLAFIFLLIPVAIRVPNKCNVGIGLWSLPATKMRSAISIFLSNFLISSLVRSSHVEHSTAFWPLLGGGGHSSTFSSMGSMTRFQTWRKGEIKISFEGRTKHVMKKTLDYDKNVQFHWAF